MPRTKAGDPLAGSRGSGPSACPDLVLYGGRILTMTPSAPYAQALAVHGDRVVAVGRDDTVLGLAGPSTVRVPLRGRTVVPGLNDSHHHLLNRAARAFHGIRLDQLTSVPRVLDAVREKAHRLGPGRVIFSNAGNAAELLDEGRTPSLAELDAAAPDNPVVLTFEDGLHVNTAMMNLSGVGSRTPTPAGGVIGRSGDALTGIFCGTARRLVRGGGSSAVGDHGTFSPWESAEALLWAQRELNSVGVTSVRNPALSAADVAVYRALAREGELTVRVSMDLDVDHVEDSIPDILGQLAAVRNGAPHDDPWLRLNGVGELWIDRSTDGMLLSHPYRALPLVADGEPGYHGVQCVSTGQLTELVVALNRAGWRPLVHAGGDLAIDVLLDAFEKADSDLPIDGRRWVLDHAHYGMPRHIERVRRLGLVVAMQYHPYLYYPLFAALHGADRAAHVFPAGGWLDAGIVVAGGSDYSKVPANLFEGVAFWTTRATMKWGTTALEHRVTREQALRMLTRNAAHLTFEEHLKGTLAPGRLADLAVLSGDYLEAPDEELASLTSLMTVAGGRVVHRDPGFDADVPERLVR
ncbi:amidohydrolase [Streptomyces exfoliatus]|uniref:amidohydrolase n=1 Tax=Streptomyces exfoliatus TaxID=1905 RepID=UPI003C2DF920